MWLKYFPGSPAIPQIARKPRWTQEVNMENIKGGACQLTPVLDCTMAQFTFTSNITMGIKCDLSVFDHGVIFGVRHLDWLGWSVGFYSKDNKTSSENKFLESSEGNSQTRLRRKAGVTKITTLYNMLNFEVDGLQQQGATSDSSPVSQE